MGEDQTALSWFEGAPLDSVGEFGLIARLARRQEGVSPLLRRGIGDDAAVFRMGGGLGLLTQDMLLEGIHFERRYFRPRDLGHRALAASLSDIAAMGGEPLFFSVSLGLPGGESVEAVEELYDGMLALARRYGVTLIGGDTVRSASGIILDVVLFGEAEGRVVYRDEARVGDLLLVTGELGLAGWGLRLLQRGERDQRHPAVRAHLRPEPRVEAGKLLNRLGVTAMTDLSDGLAAELLAIAGASRVGLRVEGGSVPRPADLPAEEALDLAFYGGEDYELLFTAPPDLAETIRNRLSEAGLRAAVIGEVRPVEEGIVVTDVPDGFWREERAYDHFRRN